MIDLYTFNTFNGQRVSIMLEELGLKYTAHKVDLSKREQKLPGFLKLNPSGRIPVIVDHDSDQRQPFVLTQSVAILHYLAEKTDKFLPQTVLERARVYEWMNFHAIDIGSVIFSSFYLQSLCSPGQIKAAELLKQQVHERYSYFDQQLSEHEYLAGVNYSIADMTALPAVIAAEKNLNNYIHLTRWLDNLKLRPAVKRGLLIPNGARYEDL